jgi:acetyltransferase
MNRQASLDKLFNPRTVAIIGATEREGTVGRTLVVNLCDGRFLGNVYPVNPKRDSVIGHKAYPNIAAIPEKIDLAVIATPAETVPGVIEECVAAQVRSGVVISAGFREQGAHGSELERQIERALEKSSMRIVGPNCLGLMNPRIGLNATFAQDIVQTGSVALISQSGALLTAILDWSLGEHVGFSAIVSCGSMLDVTWGDLIQYFGDDAATQSILLYMESVGDARAFVSAVREVAFRKPVIVIKAGRTAAASKAAASHTGALTGSDAVFDAAIRRCGALRVQNISDLFYMAEVLGRQPRPRGNHLTILTNAGGPAVLATDALLAEGGELTPLSPHTMEQLDEFLPQHWSHGNPIDILGDAPPERYARALEIAANDPNSDGLLVVLAPQGMTNPKSVAEALKPYAKIPGKPVLATWMGGHMVAPGIEVLNAAGIPTFSYPDTAARAFDSMWRYTDALRGLYETPVFGADSDVSEQARNEARILLESVRASGRTVLTEAESKEVLSLYWIPTVDTRVASNETAAVFAAAEIGFPVVLKVHSEAITHKTDVGGVKLNLQSEDAVRKAYREIEASVAEKAGREKFQGVTVEPMVKLDGYELIVGSSSDPQFGPVMLFGTGGQLVEVFSDRALALPPLNSTLAQRLIEQTRIYKALCGVRGRLPVDFDALTHVLVQISRLILEQRWIAEIDINPLLASPERVIALDARIVVHDAKTKLEDLPLPAIRPYPSRYVENWKSKDGIPMVIRPIRPEDEPAMVKFHETLSDSSVYLRYFHMENLSIRVAHERLVRKCFIDYDREMALVATRPGNGTAPEIIGVGRLTKQSGTEGAEVAVLVSDRYQGHGVGSELVRRLIDVARDEKLKSIEANILPENSGMNALARNFGFKTMPDGDFSHIRAVLGL